MSNSADYELRVNEYGNVDATEVIPNGWHMTSLTLTQIKKLEIPYYKACIGFTEYKCRHFKPRLVNIIPDDFCDKEQEYLDGIALKKIEKIKRVESVELTPEVISECLYSVNKEAKRKRDIQSKCKYCAYVNKDMKYPGVYYNLHKAKREKAQLYKLKDDALDVAIRVWNLTPDGYHSFQDKDRDMYSLCGHMFHVNMRKSEIYLGEIDTEIEATRDRSTPPDKAILLLERFISENRLRN